MFAENLKKFRKLAGLRQDDIAKVIGLDRSAYAYYETGKTEPSIINLVKIAKTLGIDPNTLIGYEPAQPALEVCNDQQGGYSADICDDLGKCNSEERFLVACYRASDNKKDIVDAVRKIYEDELMQ